MLQGLFCNTSVVERKNNNNNTPTVQLVDRHGRHGSYLCAWKRVAKRERDFRCALPSSESPLFGVFVRERRRRPGVVRAILQRGAGHGGGAAVYVGGGERERKKKKYHNETGWAERFDDRRRARIITPARRRTGALASPQCRQSYVRARSAYTASGRGRVCGAPRRAPAKGENSTGCRVVVSDTRRQRRLCAGTPPLPLPNSMLISPRCAHDAPLSSSSSFAPSLLRRRSGTFRPEITVAGCSCAIIRSPNRYGHSAHVSFPDC